MADEGHLIASRQQADGGISHTGAAAHVEGFGQDRQLRAITPSITPLGRCVGDQGDPAHQQGQQDCHPQAVEG
jgi:hypothetical protein